MEKSRRSRYRWVVLVSAWLLASTVNLNLLSISPLLTVIARDMGRSFLEISLLLSLPTMIVAFVAVPTGRLVDRLGVRLMAGIGSLFLGLGGLLRGFAFDFSSLLVYTTLMAVGVGTSLPNLPKLIGDWFPKHLRGVATGVYVTGLPLGSTIGIGLAATIYSLYGGWRSVFLIWGGVTLAVSAVWWCVVRNAPGPIAGSVSSPHARRQLHMRVWRDRNVWLVSLISFLCLMTYYVETGWLPALLEEQGSSIQQAGTMVSTLTLANILGIFLIPSFSDAVGLRRPFLWLFGAVSGIASYGLASAPLASGWFFLPVMGFSIAIGAIGTFVLVAELTEPHLVGTASGMVISVGFVGALVGPLLAGYLGDILGTFTFTPYIVTITSAAIVVLTFALPETGRRKRL